MTLVAGLVLTALLLSRQLDAIADQQNQTLRNVLLQQTQLSAVPLLIADDRIGLSVLVSDMQQHPLVDAAALYRGDELVARAGSLSQGFDQTQHIQVNQQEVGILRIRWKAPDWPLSLTNLINHYGYEYALILAVLLLPMLILAFNLQSPLRALRKACLAVQMRETFDPLDERRQDEWGYVNYSFNRLHAEYLNEVPDYGEQEEERDIPQHELDLQPGEFRHDNRDALADFTLDMDASEPAEEPPFAPLTATSGNEHASERSTADSFDSIMAQTLASNPSVRSTPPPLQQASFGEPLFAEPLFPATAATTQNPSAQRASDVFEPLNQAVSAARTPSQVTSALTATPASAPPPFEPLAEHRGLPTEIAQSLASQIDETVFVLLLSQRQSAGYASSPEREEVLATYHDFINQACNLYSGAVEAMEDDHIIVVFDQPQKDDAHGINALCAALMFNGLYKSYNQRRIKALKPIINLQLALHTGAYSQLPQLCHQVGQLIGQTNSNQLVISREVYDCGAIRDKLLDDRYIRPTNGDCYLVERLQEKPQRLLERQVVHFSQKSLA
ncbi:hypothetical protein [Pokkaliibacter plantistimulans]|uniref:hypothetical protein n=1 Tax=Pokkaliibacter plantistimulans TaxID=1635171 RepID=UPI00398FBDBD